MRAVVCIGECLAVSKDAKTQSLAKEILESLPVRNEAYLGQVHSAFVQILSAQSFQARYYATISLNSIQKQMDKPPDAGIIKPLVNLLECSSVHVQQEVFDLMKLLLSYEKIKKSLLQELLKAMHITGSETDTDAADSNGGGSETNITPMEAALPDNIKQAACAHFIHQILSENSGSSDASVVKILEQGHVAEYLLYAFGNESFANSRKQAARSLRQLLHMRIENVRHVLLETLGEEFVQEIESCNDMDHVSLSVSPLQAMTMRSALLRLEYTGKLL
ncbi:uncharacterized protein LOC135809701 [Sycon ciliatum]|uniref:uncharacterized protein LOC135809701 n=1 Tax=Sycon ciliatum TaxID=27933 RepID=UPI0031F71EA8